MDREQLAAQLAHLGIRVEGRLHAPAMTCEQASALVGDLPGLRVKNLFLKESRGQRLLLVVADEQTPVNLAALAERLGTRRLSFASPERLRRHLGVEPGAVTLLALVNDGAHQVELVLERRVWEAPLVQCHPLINTETWVLEQADLRTLLGAWGRVPTLLTLP
ncbi:prolyl-tRNA synthetase associated domain-containing protein [Aeromonas simiae]|uniref:prolyl-tRNA synthetase associated domain-containing protein n=1 Tax=Aeromonas simiae TaxID=218936 RepID=UPI000A651AB6|nr:prolyl-tRNA synthetase associated domain-containing protein [Aeromonas simiae]